MSNEIHICVFCPSEVGEEDFCIGCGEFVCAACTTAKVLLTEHDKQDHEPPIHDDLLEDWLPEDEEDDSL